MYTATRKKIVWTTQITRTSNSGLKCDHWKWTYFNWLNGACRAMTDTCVYDRQFTRSSKYQPIIYFSSFFFVYENGNIERLDDEFNKFMSGNFMICKYAGVHSIKFGFYSDRIMVCNYIIATLINHPASKTEYETANIMWCQVSILFHNVFKLFFLSRWFWSHPIFV